jgi:hypothetical protein
MHLKSLFVDPAAGFRPFYQKYREFVPIAPDDGPAIVRSQRSPHARARDWKPFERSKVVHRTVEQPIRRISKTRQCHEAKIFKTFARATERKVTES